CQGTVRFELGEGRLADLDLVGAKVDVGVEGCLALVDLPLPLVELADSVADRLFHRREPLFAPILALCLGVREAFLARQGWLAARHPALALLGVIGSLPEA